MLVTKLACVILFLSLTSLTRVELASVINAPKATNPDWWQHAVVYQIYPLSFKDSDNSGEGDLQGIISKLDHLQDAGVTAAWLSPIFQSPGVDQGYDISNYREIDPKFGTMQDFDDLIREAHDRGIKIVLDFVPNHSSDKHEWFERSARREEGYENYYVWRDGNANNQPPNNWISIFKGSAWTYNEERGQYYLHQFAKEQPDLNYRNPTVVQEMKDVLQFWLDKGVDGFRLDAVPYLVEDEQFRNEPSAGNNVPPEEHASLQHIYTSDLDETFDVIYEFRKFVDDYTTENGGDTRVLMTEAYTDIKNTMRYYLDENTGELGAHFTFNFNLITQLNKDSNAIDIVLSIKNWLAYMPIQCTPNWVLGNHDQHRVATRFGPESVDGFNMLTAFLPGVMITYNGEEIGQENGEVTWEQGKDPSACNGNMEDFDRISRDFERTPFHWDSSTNAGFNDGAEPWLPVSSKYTENNLALQSEATSNSHYQIYKKLLELRKEPQLQNGILDIQALSGNVLVATRTNNEEIWLYAFNVGDQPAIVNARTVFKNITPYVQVILRSGASPRTEGTLLVTHELVLYPHESIIATITDAVPGPNPAPTNPSVVTTPGGSNPENTTPDGAATVTISIVTFIVTLYCSLIM